MASQRVTWYFVHNMVKKFRLEKLLNDKMQSNYLKLKKSGLRRAPFYRKVKTVKQGKNLWQAATAAGHKKTTAAGHENWHQIFSENCSNCSQKYNPVSQKNMHAVRKPNKGKVHPTSIWPTLQRSGVRKELPGRIFNLNQNHVEKD